MNKPPMLPFKEYRKLPQDIIGFLENYAVKYPDIYGFNALGLQAYIVQEPNFVRHVLQSNNKNYLKDEKYEVLRLLLGNGLLTSEGDFWRKQRRLAQPAFHKKRIEKLADIVVNATQGMLDKWTKQTQNQPPSTIDFTLDAAHLTIEIVSKALFGASVSDKVPKIWEAMQIFNEVSTKMVRRLINIPFWLPLPTHQQAKKAIKIMDEVILSIINERRQNSEQQHDDLLAMLMQAQDEDTGERMNDKQLKDEVMTIFSAGHETTVVALSWTMYLLAQHPEIKQQVQQEAAHILQGKAPSFAQCRQLTFITNVLNESMRLYPPAYMIGRQAINNDKLGDYDVPAKTNIIINIYSLHRHPKYWKNPSVFNPDRFNNKDLKGLQKYIYFPFGGGPRLCIGNSFAMLEMQIIIAMIIQQFDFECTNIEPVNPEPQITLKPTPTVKISPIKNTLFTPTAT